LKIFVRNANTGIPPNLKTTLPNRATPEGGIRPRIFRFGTKGKGGVFQDSFLSVWNFRPDYLGFFLFSGELRFSAVPGGGDSGRASQPEPGRNFPETSTQFLWNVASPKRGGQLPRRDRNQRKNRAFGKAFLCLPKSVFPLDHGSEPPVGGAAPIRLALRESSAMGELHKQVVRPQRNRGVSPLGAFENPKAGEPDRREPLPHKPARIFLLAPSNQRLQ